LFSKLKFIGVSPHKSFGSLLRRTKS